MVLSGVGDALGYRGARWEYCTSGPQIHAELAELGGLAAISLEPPEWPVSDDTVLHLATAEGLATGGAIWDTPLTEGRGSWGWGPRCTPGWHWRGCPCLSPKGWGVPVVFLGLRCRYPHASELPTLIRVSIESGRMTHHHPTGYLGALAVALFGALGAR
ncbi:ADPRH hydrolase, partial [Rhodinocichla rosea]|nr:ADPRH hydrolase [Rhodinocichla rosea]